MLTITFCFLVGGALLAGAAAAYLYLEVSIWRDVAIWGGGGLGGLLILTGVYGISETFKEKKTSCKACGEKAGVIFFFACPKCSYTPWWMAMGGLGLALGCLVGSYYLIQLGMVGGTVLEPVPWQFWVGLAGIVGGFIASLAMLSATQKVLLDLIGVKRNGDWSLRVRGLTIVAVLGSLPLLYFWAVEQAADWNRERVRQADQAFPDFTFAHFETWLPESIRDLKNEETFSPPYFALTNDEDSPDPTARRPVWMLVPEGTDLFDQANTVLYIDTKWTEWKVPTQQSLSAPKVNGLPKPPDPAGNPAAESIEPGPGQRMYTVTVCLLDRDEPRRRRVVQNHQIVWTSSSEPSPFRALLDKVLAEARRE